jgi:hypothetical protein
MSTCEVVQLFHRAGLELAHTVGNYSSLLDMRRIQGVPPEIDYLDGQRQCYGRSVAYDCPQLKIWMNSRKHPRSRLFRRHCYSLSWG